MPTADRSNVQGRFITVCPLQQCGWYFTSSTRDAGVEAEKKHWTDYHTSEDENS